MSFLSNFWVKLKSNKIIVLLIVLVTILIFFLFYQKKTMEHQMDLKNSVYRTKKYFKR